jgi:hypothetical protein
MTMPQKAFFERLKPDGSVIGERLPVMFNPTDLTFTRSTQLAEVNVPGLIAPLQQFIRGQAERLSVKLLFDVTDSGMGRLAKSVTEVTDKFYAFVRIHKDVHAPPLLRFMWGYKLPGSDLPAETGNQRRTSFIGVVESLQQELLVFSPRGLPLRSRVTVSMREYKGLRRQLYELGLESRDRTSVRVVRRGDTLSGIAAEAYGDPGEWRAIADENEIVDPRHLVVGATLTIPPIDRVSA